MASKRSSRAHEDNVSRADAVRPKPLPTPRRSKEDLGKTFKDQEQGRRTDDAKDTAARSSVASSSTDRSTPSASITVSNDGLSAYPAIPLVGRPENFGVIMPGVYRSSYPRPPDYDFLQSLQLRTVVTLVQKDEDVPDLVTFLSASNVHHIVIPMKGTKKEAIPAHTMKIILAAVYDARNYPLLVHCNHGKHRTGCVVGVMRRISGWSLAETLAEYRHYADPKVRDCDVEYLRAFQVAAPVRPNVQPVWPPFRLSRSFGRVLILAAIVATIWIISANQLSTTRFFRPPARRSSGRRY